MRLTIGSLFSGIGGLERGLEMAGLGPVVFQCELDAFCNRVLAKHWPNVTRYSDVTSVRDYPYVDIICGGFPCTDLSSAGKQAGLSGSRSGLWYHYARIIQKVRPRFVVVENVASGARLWLPTVRRQLHLLGYDSTAYRISAADVGAPHLRRRIFVVANTDCFAIRQQPGRRKGTGGADSIFADGTGEAGVVGDTDGQSEPTQEREPTDEAVALADRRNAREEPGGGTWWSAEPGVGCVVDGVPDRLARRRINEQLKALGNAVVPQCAEVVGRIIVRMAGAS